METAEAQDAGWPPILDFSGLRRPWLAWSMIFIESHSEPVLDPLQDADFPLDPFFLFRQHRGR